MPVLASLWSLPRGRLAASPISIRARTNASLVAIWSSFTWWRPWPPSSAPRCAWGTAATWDFAAARPDARMGCMRPSPQILRPWTARRLRKCRTLSKVQPALV